MSWHPQAEQLLREGNYRQVVHLYEQLFEQEPDAGIEEGIAWSDEEYVECGIRLGTDEVLGEQIFSKLREGRKRAPLWNAQQFTREMESAYQQMFEA